MKRKVQAQRKFAQGAYIPPSVSSSVPAPAPVEKRSEPARAPAENVYHSNLPASKLLDRIAFRNLHDHKNVVILLERLGQEGQTTTPVTKPIVRSNNRPLKAIVPATNKNTKMLLRSRLPTLNYKAFKPAKIKKRKANGKVRKNNKNTQKISPRMIRKRGVKIPKKRHVPVQSDSSDLDDDMPLKYESSDLDDDRPLKYLTRKAAMSVSEKTIEKAGVAVATAVRQSTDCEIDDAATTESEYLPLKRLCVISNNDIGLRPLSICENVCTPNDVLIENTAKSPTHCESSSVNSRVTGWLSDIVTPFKIPSVPHKRKVDHREERRVELHSVNNKQGCDISVTLESEGSVEPQHKENGCFRRELEVDRDCQSRCSVVIHSSGSDLTQGEDGRAYHSARSVIIESDEREVSVPRTSSPCPSERYTSVRDIINALDRDLRLRCNNCYRCIRFNKVHDMMSCACTKRANDVYEFHEDMDDAMENPKLDNFRQNRKTAGPQPARVPNTAKPLYFNIHNCRSDHIVEILPAKSNTSDAAWTAHIVSKSKANIRHESSLAELESLLDHLRVIKKSSDTECCTKNNDKSNEDSRTKLIPEDKNADEDKQEKESLVTSKKSKPIINKKNQRRLTNKRNLGTRSRQTKVTEITDQVESNNYEESSASRVTNRRKTIVPAKGKKKVNAAEKPKQKQLASKRGRPAVREPLPSCSNQAAPPSTSIYDDCESSLAPTPLPPTQEAVTDHKQDDELTRESQTSSAPVFHPSEAEFKDPLAYFEKVIVSASRYGICKVVAPAGFKPRCENNDEVRFNVTNQYIPRLYSRWGPAAREMCAMKSYLASQSVLFTRAPLFEGLELNLPRLYHTVQRHGGLKKVLEKKRWNRVATDMRFTRGPHPYKRVEKLYVKYLLPYDTLSSKERLEKLSAAEMNWNKKNKLLLERATNPLHRQKQLLGESSSSDDDSDDESNLQWALSEAEDCIVPGRNMSHQGFKAVAESATVQLMPSGKPLTPDNVEEEYWRLMLLGSDHVCVNAACVDTTEERLGFTKDKQDPYGRHPWNLKVLTQNSRNVLRYMGPVVGVTVPMVHLGMLFSTSCWHRDPHGLPWIEYMHEGPGKIWYGIPDSQSDNFRRAVERLCPTSCQNKSIWLPSDITMIPPNLLRENNVTLSRTVQRPGEYIIVFPKAYSCSICTGYTQSETVYFATNSWLDNVMHLFQEVRDSCEPTMFSLEQLLMAVARDGRTPLHVLQQAQQSLTTIITLELEQRSRLLSHLPAEQNRHRITKKRPAGAWNVREQDECEICRTTLYLSKVTGLTSKRSSLCLTHALRLLETPPRGEAFSSRLATPARIDASNAMLMIFFTARELRELLLAVQTRLRV